MKKIIILLLITATLLSSCSQTTETNQNKIIISEFSFQPSELTTTIGTTITWINQDSVPHTIVFGDIESEIINNDETYNYTFTEAGTYEYICSLHPSMKGTIIVE